MVVNKKTCPSCGIIYSNKKDVPLTNHFYADPYKRSGLHVYCKSCMKKKSTKLSVNLKAKRYKEKNKKIVQAREEASAHYKGFDCDCYVITCYEKAKELHHVDYNDSLAVIPMCKKHHMGLHEIKRTKTWLENNKKE